MWGRPPGLRADVHVGLVGATTKFDQRDLEVPRRPGGLPHNEADPVCRPVRFLTVAARLGFGSRAGKQTKPDVMNRKL